ncbi:uncharacterized protein MKK02DRAFT_30799 [Dioszegia hungarica]|uniref:Uncharacterized protein n=1 Tax=Dioszegia hungarica TaxID=4972 RepID=A0AA38H344_9TREE|nr:uncharacterized protein MKK02DRAFT_30799 [Dioszegia hungarica]KAI9631796.1 hypothetical protein MKK02DRAFT_30799 [Dioszegia hungarica]
MASLQAERASITSTTSLQARAAAPPKQTGCYANVGNTCLYKSEVVLIGVGVAVFVLLLIGVAICICLKRRKSRKIRAAGASEDGHAFVPLKPMPAPGGRFVQPKGSLLAGARTRVQQML